MKWLGELVNSGLIQVGDGYRTKKAELSDHGIPILRVADVADGRLNPSFTDRISESMRSKIGSKLSRVDDVLITTKGTVGRAAIVPSSFPEHAYSPQLCFLRVIDRAQLDPRWIYYWVRSPAFAIQAAAVMGQTDMAPYVSLGDLKRFDITPPLIHDQRRIAGVLGALDDLIDTNDSTRNSLVALVDSEFHRRFGQRPLGIKVGQLAKVVDCLHSKKPQQVPESQHLLLQLNNIRDDGLLDIGPRYLISEDDYVRWSKNLETEAHDLVVTNVGRVGAVARVPVATKAALGRNMTAIRTNDPESDAAFLAIAMLSPSVRREIESKTDSGTILNALNVRSIPLLRLPESAPEERRQFGNWALPLLETCDSLLAQNIELRRTRDELLPLLMSGRVRVAEAEKIIS